MKARYVNYEKYIAEELKKQTEDEECVQSPSHYTKGPVEAVEVIKAALTQEEFEGYLKGSVLKYYIRHQYKGGNIDLKKALWFQKRLVEEID